MLFRSTKILQECKELYEQTSFGCGVDIAPVISKLNQICFQTLYGLGVCRFIKKLCVLLKSDILTSFPLLLKFGTKFCHSYPHLLFFRSVFSSLFSS